MKEIELIGYAVSKFSTKMYEKMKKQWRRGKRGWADPTFQEQILKDFLTKSVQIGEGDYTQCVDAANFLMMLDNFQRGNK